jgi:hypothetical protein
MQIKIINTETLNFHIVNVKFGTIEDVLNKAKEDYFSDLNIEDNIKPVNNLFKLGKYLCDIVYVGKIGGRATSGRQTRDWEPEIEQLRKFYSPDRTVKQMSVLSGIAVGRVYYLLKMKNWEYKKGQRGKRK